jgi:hypothetical protein
MNLYGEHFKVRLNLDIIIDINKVVGEEVLTRDSLLLVKYETKIVQWQNVTAIGVSHLFVADDNVPTGMMPIISFEPADCYLQEYILTNYFGPQDGKCSIQAKEWIDKHILDYVTNFRNFLP